MSQDKNIINSHYHSARNNIVSIQKSKMALSDRIYYEKALVHLEAMKLIIDKYSF